MEGRHYTGYQATQMQRKLERTIRAQKRRCVVDEAAGDGEKLSQDRTRLNILHQRYREFSKAAGLRTQYERTEVAGFGKRSLDKQAKSGIIDPNRSKEIPEMTGTPTPVPQPRAPVRLASRDVTEEYLRMAAPGQGSITYEDGYQVKGHQSEIAMAD